MDSQVNRKNESVLLQANPSESVADGGELKITTGIDQKFLAQDRNNLRVSKVSFYRDDVWIFASEFPKDPPSKTTLYFANLYLLDGSNITEEKNESYLRIYKEFAYSLLTSPPPRPPKWKTCIATMQRRGLAWLLRYMCSQKIYSLAELTSSDIRQFLCWLATFQPTQRRLVPAKSKSHLPVKEMGRSITNETLISRTKGLNWLYLQRKKMRDGLVTDPWLEHKNALNWANSVCKKRVDARVSRTPEMPDSISGLLLTKALEELSGYQRYIDVRTAQSLYVTQEAGRQFCKERGTQYRKITQLQGFPWKSYGYENAYGPRRHRGRLIAAAYIVVASLTGMRAHEILNISSSLDESWREVDQHAADGTRVTSYFIISTTSKLHPTAKEEMWQTLPIAKSALKVLSEINSQHINNGNNRLFSSPLHGKTEFKGSMACNSLNIRLHEFAAYHSVLVEGVPYKASSHQFRKKFSRLMFRQGLGIKELQDQLKHFDVEMTRLYGEPNLYAELQEERFTVSKEIYEELFRQTTPIIGGGAVEFRKIQRDFLGKIRSDQDRMLDELPRSALIDRVDEGFCLFNAKRALCGSEKVNCKPARCLNAVIPLSTAIRSLEYRKRENERLLQCFHDHPLKVSHLKSQLETIDALLDQAANNPGISTIELKRSLNNEER